MLYQSSSLVLVTVLLSLPACSPSPTSNESDSVLATAATGKKFKLAMLTVGRWENGVMKEEWLYWDNAAFMSQIGVGQ